MDLYSNALAAYEFSTLNKNIRQKILYKQEILSGNYSCQNVKLI